MSDRIQIRCDECERIVSLTEDGYCPHCGKHADNIRKAWKEWRYGQEVFTLTPETAFHAGWKARDRQKDSTDS